MSRIFFPRGGACVRSAGRPAVTSLAAAAFLAACIYAHAIAFSCALERALATCLVKVFLAEAACCIICERGNCLLRMRIRRQCATCVGYVCGVAPTARYTAKLASCAHVTTNQVSFSQRWAEFFGRHCMLVSTAVCYQWQLTAEHNQHGVYFIDSSPSLTKRR